MASPKLIQAPLPSAYQFTAITKTPVIIKQRFAVYVQYKFGRDENESSVCDCVTLIL